jgi:hypothetical protein
MKRLALFAVMILLTLAACQDQPQAEPTDAPAAQTEAELIEEQAAEQGEQAAQEATAVTMFDSGPAHHLLP